MNRISRRDFLRNSAAAASALALAPNLRAAEVAAPNIAVVVTEFRPNSHADVLGGRFFEGWNLDGGPGPQSKPVSLYMDQLAPKDIGTDLAAKHKVGVHKTIREALCRGGDKLAVDGVLIIGEHGSYPYNDKGQHLYPRRQFFEQTAQVFADSGRSVPVFSDKHLSFSWENAKWMYDRAVELKIPFMAGSSVPTTWRYPDVDLELGSQVEGAVAVGYGGPESYGFHALEGLQCQLERRKGGETGVAAVTCIEGPAVWEAADKKVWSQTLLDAAISRAKAPYPKGTPRTNAKNPIAFVIEYRDGLRATLLMLNGAAREFLFAASVAGKAVPLSTVFWLEEKRPYGHFEHLARGIDRMFVTGKPTWPVERTLLTTGILDAAMTSKFEKGKRIETPHLAIRYEAGPAWKQPPAPAGR